MSSTGGSFQNSLTCAVGPNGVILMKLYYIGTNTKSLHNISKLAGNYFKKEAHADCSLAIWVTRGVI